MSSKTKTAATKEEATPALVPKLRFPEFRAAKHWSATTVGRISNTVIAGGTPSTSEKKFWGGEIRWMNSGELNDKKVCEVQGRITREGLNNSSTKVIPRRCVLIGLAGQGKTRGTVAMNLVELCTNQSIAAIFPNDSVFNSEFLYHDLDKRYDELRRLSAGGEGRGGLNLQIIKSLLVLLPSLPEQQKIAECLSSVDELIAAQAWKLDALKTHKKGLMQQLFPRDGETQPRLRFPEFQNAGEWADDTLGAVCELYQPVTLSSSQLSMTGEHLVYGANGVIGTHNEYNHEESEIAVTCRGATCGEVTITKPKSWVTGNAMIVKPRTKKLRKDFIFQYFKNHGLKAIISGSAQPQITRTGFAPLVVFFPKPEEQQRIADCLTSLDDLIAAQTQKLEALKTHKKGLMQQLFPSPEEPS